MTSINQAVYVPNSSTYKFLGDVSANLPVVDAPSDANWRRWSMLHDGSDYRMYCFKGSTHDTLYQFGWDGSSYKYGHNSYRVLTISGIPDDADTNSFSMLYGEEYYRVYFRQLGNPNKLYQFLWDQEAESYVPGPALPISGFPDDTDWSRWSMLNDGNDYRIYAFKLGSNNEFYQGAWNGSEYKYGYKSANCQVLTLENIPPSCNLASMAMLHDGSEYRFYMQTL
ncbi:MULTISPECIES: hypothetical protein [unclassified Okeania]|uniref:hypothetical protein n=1 Tax=unclassified Okeania TaxID=2634635 RepID=UPI0013BAD390|nr:MULTISPECIES: hypothetical protein [unclassified Okeania]NES78279.1 hypothetical protein [Okeania sp. SIO1H4]NET15536.1 hypothetical protein [Okeania sp. SIO1H6]NET21619.1 hypothetical protein [Okeania sp. SIO1H5]NET94968.1 hypothetical protein [Okeania sp. SIO1H2]